MRAMYTAGLGLAVALLACGTASRLVNVTSPSSSGPGVSAPSVSAPAGSTSSASAPSLRAGAGSASDLISVPDFTGKTLEEAQAMATAAGFLGEVAERPMHCEGAPKLEGRITCQDPESGKPWRRYGALGVAVYKAWKHPGIIVRDQLLPLIGMTLDQARARLQELGHTGKLVVTRAQYHIPKCGQNKICALEHEAGIAVTDDLIVTINPNLDISAPPD